MSLSRRKLLLSASALPFAARALADLPANAAPAGAIDTRLPFKAGFADMDVTYLDSGSQHPISLGAQSQARQYIAHRALEPEAADYERNDRGVLEKYAAMVNADVEEVTFVQSTTTAEQMFLRSLGFPEAGGHIVTDTLHFFGSIPLYLEMQKQGMDVTFVRDHDGPGQMPVPEQGTPDRAGLLQHRVRLLRVASIPHHQSEIVERCGHGTVLRTPLLAP